MGDPAKPLEHIYDRLLSVPEHLLAEILDGEIVTQPRPASLHARAATRLVSTLDGSFDRGHDGPGGWIILYEPELHLPRSNVLVPGVAGWRRTRMPELPDTAAFELPPDWICEILSPTTAVRDRTQKMPIYANVRVQHLWLIEPGLRTLEVFRLDGEGWRVVGTWDGGTKVRAEPFEAMELDLGELWAR